MSGLYIERKRDFHVRWWLSGLVFVCLLAISGWFGYRWYTTGDVPSFIPLPASALADPTVNETKISKTDIENYRVDTTHPRYISIPALNIDKVRVQKVGMTVNRTLAMPDNINDAGWYSQSAYPGQGYGAVLIDGHNTGINRNGAFVNLDKLKKDDEIIITRGDGKKVRYLVVENKTETLQEANTTGMQRLLTSPNKTSESLGLITTGGNWIPRDKVYDKRILIRAVAQTENKETARASKK